MESDANKHGIPPSQANPVESPPGPPVRSSTKPSSGKRRLPRPPSQKPGRATVRLVDKSPASGSSPAGDRSQNRPPVGRQESAHEYSATGLDETASRIPRKPSQKPKGKSGNFSKTNQANGTTHRQGTGEEAEEATSNASGLAAPATADGPDEVEAETRNTQGEAVPRHVEDIDANWVSHGSENGAGSRPGHVEGQVVETNDPRPGSNGTRGEASDPDEADQVAGIRFAPWSIPIRRRLQTTAVILHSLSILSLVSTFFFICAVPFLWPLVIVYMVHILVSTTAIDGSLRSRSEKFRRLRWWRHFANYFPARLHKTQDLPPTRKYIFGYHPHGIISHGAFATVATEACGFGEKFPGITNSLLTLESNFRTPLYREYLLAMGLASVSKDSIYNILTRGGANGEGMGRAVTIVVGGARESLEAQPGTMHLVLKERKGFIKLALRTGADLVPIMAFGENDLYDQVRPETHPGLRRLQMFILRTLKFTVPFLHGRGIFNYDVGMMPYRQPLNIVVGHPVHVAQAIDEEHLDPKEIDRLHGLYIAELFRLWETYKDKYAKNRKEEMQLL